MVKGAIGAYSKLTSDQNTQNQNQNYQMMPNKPNHIMGNQSDRTQALDRTQVKAGTNIKVTFELKDRSNQQLITNLQPYLGEQGHLVIIKQSSPLTRRDYIHAHAMSNTSPGQVEFMTKFPTPGNYKLWGQFNRNGEIITVDFWVNVI